MFLQNNKSSYGFVLFVSAILLCSGVINLSFAENSSIHGPTSSDVDTSEKIVVYYFHGNMRCRTCRKIEALTQDAVASEFNEAVKNGKVVLSAINLEEGDNDHFVEDYQLITRTVVISKRKDDVEVSWKRLDRVWQLVRNEVEFKSYITNEINTLLSGSS